MRASNITNNYKYKELLKSLILLLVENRKIYSEIHYLFNEKSLFGSFNSVWVLNRLIQAATN